MATYWGAAWLGSLLALSRPGGAGGESPRASAEPAPRRFEAAETHMGSEFKIVLYSADEAAARRAFRAAFDRITSLDAAFSDYQPDSELMRLCDRAGGPPVAVSDDLFLILHRAKSVYERSEGAFDVTVGPVVRLWRRARRDGKMPSEANLARARVLVSMDAVVLDEKARTVRLTRRGMKLDLGGIAKGYASQAALDVIRSQGISRVLVAGAGDIVVGASPPGRDGWTVGLAPVEDPRARPELYLSLHDVAVSTSGDAERFVVIDGKRYAHIVDPRTGLGVVDRGSVTVVAPHGATADALATAAFVLGPERGLNLVDSTEGASAVFTRVLDGKRVIRETPHFSKLPRTQPRVGKPGETYESRP